MRNGSLSVRAGFFLAFLFAAPIASAQVVTLSGTHVELPVGAGGQLLRPGGFFSSGAGGRYDRDGAGPAGFIDFWYPGTPVYNVSIGVDGAVVANGGSWVQASTVTDESAGTENRAVVVGQPFANVDFRRVIRFEDGDRFVLVTDTITNRRTTSIGRVVVLDSTDPDQGAPTYPTANDVAQAESANDIVTAYAASTNLAMAFASPSPLRNVSVGGFNNTDVYLYDDLLSDPQGAIADQAINLAMNYGTLAPGESKTASWYIVFGDTQADVIARYVAARRVDLSAGKVESADPVAVGATYSYTLAARNGGRSSAHDVVVTDELPPSLAFVSATSASGTCTSTGQVVRCSLRSVPAGVTATATVTVRARFTGTISNTATVSSFEIDTAAANDVATEVTTVTGPDAKADAYAIDEDTPLVVAAPGVLGNDTAAAPLTAALEGAPTKGTVSLNADGSFRYVPNANATGTDTFTYRAIAGPVASLGVVTITIRAVNDLPVATTTTATTAEDVPVAIVLAATDAEGEALTFAVSAGPTRGTLSGTAPNLTYTPAANVHGSDAFDYTITDASGGRTTARVTVTVTPVNDAPVALSQTVNTRVGVAVPFVLEGTDVEGDVLTFEIVGPPPNGTIGGTLPNVLYTPRAGFTGTDSFTFRVRDGALASVVATVFVNVTSGDNLPPVAADSTATTNEESTVLVTLQATDPNGDALTYAVVASPSFGTLSGTAPALRYLPQQDFYGTDSFTWFATDGRGVSAVVKVTITVLPVNDLPRATAQNLTTAEETPLPLTLSGADPDGDNLRFGVTRAPRGGTLSGTPPILVYTPGPDFTGNDDFDFVADDGQARSAPATVRITVTNVNDAPRAQSAVVTTAEETPVAVLLAGDDVDGDRLAFEVTGAPSHGTLSGTPPNLVYTPARDFVGQDAIRFRVRDASTFSVEGLVAITVTPVNDRPIASALAVTTAEDTAVAVLLVGADADGERLTYEVVGSPTHGRLTGTPTELTYTPDADFAGTDLFTYRVLDATTSSELAPVVVTVTPVNDAPVATGATITLPEDGRSNVTLLAADPERDVVTFELLERPAHGTLTGVAPNFVYVPERDFNGTDRLVFVARDLEAASEQVVVTLEVTPVNDAPVGVAAIVETPEDEAVRFVLEGTDVDGDALVFAVVADPEHGRLTGRAPDLRYTPDRDYTGRDSFLFTVSDGAATSVATRFTVSVGALNDPPFFVPPTPDAPVDGLEGEAVVFVAVARDVDGPSVSYALANAPSAARIDSVTGAFRWLPVYEDVGEHTFSITASDGALSETRSITVVVSARDDDGDGLPDTWERRNGLDPTTVDSDEDTIDDATEVGSIETPRDTDGDGVLDALDDDSDGDGALDAEEAGDADLATAPVDTDEDGTPDVRDLDADEDGVADESDNCRVVQNPEQVDADGDETGDACDDDRDGDGLSNAREVLLGLDPDKADTDGDTIADGAEVGEGDAALDTDDDGTIDALDTDSDNDGVSDAEEAGDADLATAPVDTDGNGQPDFRSRDSDGDSVADGTDNCRIVANADQSDLDGNGEGDACDGDQDGDGIANEADNCLRVANAEQLDTDADRVGDACDADDDGDGVPDAEDNCGLVVNADQSDTDADHEGDVCDADDDGDTVPDEADNCPLAANADQSDEDDDGAGDACDATPDVGILTGGCTTTGAELLALAGLVGLVRRRRTR